MKKFSKHGTLFLIVGTLFLTSIVVSYPLMYTGEIYFDDSEDETYGSEEDNYVNIAPPDFENILDSNIDGLLNTEISGSGYYNSINNEENYVNSENIYINSIPRYDYESASITVTPEFVYKIETLSSDEGALTTKKIDLDFQNYDLYSDIEVNLSSVEYKTKMEDQFNIVGSNAEVSGSTNVNYYGLGAQAIDYSMLPDSNLEISVDLEVAVEIMNSEIGPEQELIYQDYWDLITYYYDITLNAISLKQKQSIVVADHCWWEASIGYDDNGVSKYFIFDSINDQHGKITTQDILSGTPNDLSNGVWEYNNLEFENPASLLSSNLTEYSHNKGFGLLSSNPVITFRFSARGKGHNLDGWDPTLNYLWVKIDIANFGTAHRFKWNSTQNNGIGHYNSINDVRLTIRYDNKPTEYFTIDNFGYELIKNGWSQRQLLFSDYDFLILQSNENDIYEEILFEINNVNINYYKSNQQTHSDLLIKGLTMQQNADSWFILTNNLTDEPYFSDNLEYSEVLFDIIPSNWEIGYQAYNGYMYKYQVIYNEFSYNFSLNYENGHGNKLISLDGSFFNHMTINWENFTLIGNYIEDLTLNNNPITEQEIERSFLYYENHDFIWLTSVKDKSIIWQPGYTENNLLIECQMDIELPSIQSYSIHDELLGDEEKEFSITATDNTGIIKALIVFENDLTKQKSTFILDNQENNIYNLLISFYDLNIGNYSSWYGLIDRAGNSRTTESFSFNVSGDNFKPNPFLLFSDAEDPDDDGNFTLSWDSSINAVNYSIYQDGYLLAEGVEVLFYKIEFLGIGNYHYEVKSFNQYGNARSNLIFVSVGYAPLPFLFTTDANNPDLDGNFSLMWEISIVAKNYSLYITENVNGENLTVIETGLTNLSYLIINYQSGNFFFQVISFNNFGNYSSNIIKVRVIIVPVIFAEDDDDDDDDDKEEKINKNSNLSMVIMIIGTSIGTISGTTLIALYFTKSRKDEKLLKFN